MRLFTLHALAAMLALTTASLAEARMYKCTARDGTVLYQARPCSAGEREAPLAQEGATTEGGTRRLADNDPRLSPRSTVPPRDAQERAIAERDVAQRRARCGTSREFIDRLTKVLDSANEVQRHQAANEIKAHERRMRDDACASL